ncbi:MFS transporter [Francisella salimarina]|uniref:MFS transporter n=1 Tax=Francisella salimarina TaxID=2599927 RepID=UPI0037534171
MKDLQLKTIFLCSLGMVLEYFDFIIYLSFSEVIGAHLLHSSNSQIIILLIFALGFVTRPIGGIIFGQIGDRVGRKKVLVAAVLLMTIGTLGIGLIPDASVIGIYAGLLLLTFRIMQGLSAGGEVNSAFTYLNETIITNKIYPIAAIMISAAIGVMLAKLLTIILNFIFPENYAWRIAFILGSTLGIVTFYIRKELHESPLFTQLLQTNQLTKNPIIELFKHYKMPLLGCFLMTANVMSCITLFYYALPSYLTNLSSYSSNSMLKISIIGLLMMCIFGLLSALLIKKDSIPKLDNWFLLLSSILSIWLCYAFIHSSHYMVAYLVYSILFSAYIMIAQFRCINALPVKVRLVGMGIGYGLGSAVFVGFMPLITQSLILEYHSLYVPAFIAIITAVLSLVGSLILNITSHTKKIKL